MSALEVYGVLGTGILIMLASGSVFMLVHNWYKHGTNERLTKLEEGQANLNQRLTKLEEGQANLNKRMDKLEEGQANLNKRMDKLETRLDSLEVKIDQIIQNMIKA